MTCSNAGFNPPSLTWPLAMTLNILLNLASPASGVFQLTDGYMFTLSMGVLISEHCSGRETAC